ncbi:MAG: hypothetical protein ABIQ40_03860 [Bacteroidia bacterium]
MIKKIFLIAAVITAVITISLLYLHFTRLEPTTFSGDGFNCSIKKIVNGETTCFLLLNENGAVADSNLCGSTDLLCDPPYLIRYDMNNDGEDDLYLHECGGHGYLSYEKSNGKFNYTELGQYDAADISAKPRFLFDLLKSGDTLLYAIFAGASSLIAFILFLVLRRKYAGKNIS